MDADVRYRYDEDQCAFVEVTPSRRRYVVYGAIICTVALVLACGFAWSMDAQLIETPEEQALAAENRALREKLQAATQQMTTLTSKLETFAQRDQRLYRTLLQMEPISADVRKVGVGGSDPYAQYDRFSESTAALLRTTSRTLDKLERKSSLQSASYRELIDYTKRHEKAMRQLPVLRPTDGPIVSGYGMRHHPILKVRTMHEGLDFVVRTGTPVVAPGDGVVRRARYSSSYGNYVDIYHRAAGYVTRYAHLSEFADGIRRGARVERGQVIAYSGNTGRSTGPHLHYEVRTLNGRTLDPIRFVMPDMSPQKYQELKQRTKAYQQMHDGPSMETTGAPRTESINRPTG
ncbi:peptidoglycan DD-metalloendopeptidase family protein [Salisaeta longa]|uniref:peptidoglycan DD-metalloendopeptidase family protein n=1 Tax=Salisaeta longa TaxID=503170 RepID=UPI0003B4C40D|nr:peptidoglycan DD-metalloendopeptidase family protein [Salisaeta longa]